MADVISFYDAPSPIALSRLADEIDVGLREGDDGAVEISGVAPLEAASKGSLSFMDNPRYLKVLADTGAAAVICSKRYADRVPRSISVLIADQPYKAFARAAALLFPQAMRPLPLVSFGVSKQANISDTATIGRNATIEAGAIIGAGAQIGDGAYVGPGAIVGSNVRIGRDTSISAQASVIHAIVGDRVILQSGVRVGGDGFGFAMGPGGHLKVPQTGRVVIQDDVEVGANSCIDRGSNRDTMIGEGTKIDNLVMIGHNVVIGRHCVIVAQTGIAGSAELGDYVVLGGKCAINGHLKIGDGCQIAGLSGVSGDVPAGSIWGGVPARPIRHWMRDVARIRREAFADERQGGSKDHE